MHLNMYDLTEILCDDKLTSFYLYIQLRISVSQQ